MHLCQISGENINKIKIKGFDYRFLATKLNAKKFSFYKEDVIRLVIARIVVQCPKSR